MLCEAATLASFLFVFPETRKVGIARFAVVLLGVNLFSHGVFFQTFELVHMSYWPKLIGFEILITIFEALVYWKLLHLLLKYAFAFSLAANAASLVLGLVFL